MIAVITTVTIPTLRSP